MELLELKYGFKESGFVYQMYLWNQSFEALMSLVEKNKVRDKISCLLSVEQHLFATTKIAGMKF